VVGNDDGLGDREAESSPSCCSYPGVVCSPEPFEGVVRLFVGHSRSVVGDADGGPIVMVAGVEADWPVWIGVDRRVGEEISYRAKQ
jgi:hypothetical protein